jgi:non-specific serine/threonine protein kinase/serine/threonine-protein kinase
MTDDVVARVYRAALARPEKERAEFLALACGGDAELRAAVEGMLASADSDLPTLDVEPGPVAQGDVPARRIGPYRVLGLIGHGGMGAVYRAVREDAYEKVVALKLLRAGFEDETARARFEAERRLLARLEHAYIARLYDGGTTAEGSPYLVMEYVDGLPIQRFCAERSLSVRARVELFLKACQAVEYAHRSLIVHRDLKPGNLLVSTDGTPKLLDFGIAKLLPEPGVDAEDVPTATVLQALTPDYASPEQVRGEAVTVTADVYALGVMLYELLAGRRPYQISRLDPREIARVVCEVDPPRPSEIARLPPTVPAGTAVPVARLPAPPARLDADLDAIVMKALRKEPARRYPSVSELSDDLRRYLEGRPVLARPDTFAYRTGKFLRRRRGLVTAAAVVALTIVGGVAATLQQARRAENHRQRAERRFGEVRSLANALLFDIYDTVETLAGATPVREQIVKHGLKYLDTLAGEAEDDPVLQRELASAYQRMGDVQGYPFAANLGDLDGALASYGKAIALQKSLLRALPQDDRLQRALVVSHERLSDTLRATGQTEQALVHARDARALCEDLLAKQPGDLARQRTCLISRLKVAECLLATGDRAAARALFEEARDVAQRIPVSEPFARRDLTVVENKLGDVYLAEGDPARALARYRAALDIRQAVLASSPDNGEARRDVSVSLGKVSDAQLALGDLTGALASQRSALVHDEAMAAADPADVQGQFDVAWTLGSLATLLARTGQPGAALDHVQRALSRLEPLVRSPSPTAEMRLEHAKLLFQLGGLKAATGDLPGGKGAFAQAQSEARALVGSDPNDAETRTALAGRCAEARAQIVRVSPSAAAGLPACASWD